MTPNPGEGTSRIGLLLCMVVLCIITARVAPASETPGAPGATTPQPPATSGGRNAPAQQGKPPLVLISIDGYRWDYPDRYPTPTIRRIVDGGQRAEALEPVWPTLTFPNHYSLITGQTPAEHGLVGNSFPDGERWYALRDRTAVEDGTYYGGEPVWITAERSGMVTASMFWVGSEADIQGVHPTHWSRFNEDVGNDERVDQVLAWLSEPETTRPGFITLYFEEVDSWSHYRGVGSPEMQGALARVDAALGRLMDGIGALEHGDEVTVVIVSDHGQMGYFNEPPFVLDDHIYLDGLRIVDQGPAVYAWQDEPDPEAARRLADTINTVWRFGRAYTRASAPADWGINDHPRMPHLVFQADPGHAVLSRADRRGAMSEGDHGWAPETPEMRGVFIALGPGIEAGSRVDRKHVTDVASWVKARLGLE